MAEITLLRVDSRSYLRIGSESVEVSDYQVKSSADGTTELSVVISGSSSVFELSANLEKQTQPNKRSKIVHSVNPVNSKEAVECKKVIPAVKDLKSEQIPYTCPLPPTYFMQMLKEANGKQTGVKLVFTKDGQAKYELDPESVPEA